MSINRRDMVTRTVTENYYTYAVIVETSNGLSLEEARDCVVADSKEERELFKKYANNHIRKYRTTETLYGVKEIDFYLHSTSYDLDEKVDRRNKVSKTIESVTYEYAKIVERDGKFEIATDVHYTVKGSKDEKQFLANHYKILVKQEETLLCVMPWERFNLYATILDVREVY